MKDFAVCLVAILLIASIGLAQKNTKVVKNIMTPAKTGVTKFLESQPISNLSIGLKKVNIENPIFSPSGRYMLFLNTDKKASEKNARFQLYDFKNDKIVGQISASEMYSAKMCVDYKIAVSFSEDESILFVFGRGIALYSTDLLKFMYKFNLPELNFEGNMRGWKNPSFKCAFTNQNPHTLVYKSDLSTIVLSLDSLNIVEPSHDNRQQYSPKEYSSLCRKGLDTIIIVHGASIDIVLANSGKVIRRVFCEGTTPYLSDEIETPGAPRPFAIARNCPLIVIPFIVGGGDGVDAIKINGKTIVSTSGNGNGENINTKYYDTETTFPEKNILTSRNEMYYNFIKFIVYNYETDSVVSISCSPENPFQSESRIPFLDISEDGTFVIASNGSYTKMWDVQTGIELVELPCHVAKYVQSKNILVIEDNKFVRLPPMKTWSKYLDFISRMKDSIQTNIMLKGEYETREEYSRRVNANILNHKNMLLGYYDLGDDSNQSGMYLDAEGSSLANSIRPVITEIWKKYKKFVTDISEFGIAKSKPFKLSKYDAESKEFKIYWLDGNTENESGTISVPKNLAERFAKSVENYSVKFYFDLQMMNRESDYIDEQRRQYELSRFSQRTTSDIEPLYLKYLFRWNERYSLEGVKEIDGIILDNVKYGSTYPEIPEWAYQFSKRYGLLEGD